ncbi:MAG: hypothetical protein ACLQG5_07910 [Methanobacterium sp.]
MQEITQKITVTPDRTCVCTCYCTCSNDIYLALADSVYQISYKNVIVTA